MNIKLLNVQSNFRYLWLKKIHDVDLSKHCANCLIGEYDNRIKKEVKIYENLHLSDNIYYLCGVAYPFKWENNFHFAFKPKVGSIAQISYNGITIIVEDAEQLPIDEKYIDWQLPKAKFKSYHTCRNWQFANFLKSSHILF